MKPGDIVWFKQDLRLNGALSGMKCKVVSLESDAAIELEVLEPNLTPRYKKGEIIDGVDMWQLTNKQP